MRTRTIRQTASIPAAPADVYRAIMTSRGHAAFTGSPARMSGKVGRPFTAGGGYIHGKNLELVPGKRIVQSWRASEDGWPKRHFSTVTFQLRPTPRGTRLEFTQIGVPAEYAGAIAAGWKEYYWAPLRQYFGDAGETR